MNKHSYLIFPCLALCASLTACGGEPLDSNGPSPDVEEPSLEPAAARSGVLNPERPHCVVQTVAVREGEPAPAADARDAREAPKCFGTFAEAISAATDGAVRLAPSVRPQDLDESALAASGGGNLLSSYVIGIEYQHINYGGGSLTFTSGYTCYGYNHYVTGMPWGWNDIISSSRAFSYCNNSWHYEHNYWGGAATNCGTACSYIGDAMNDRTSSLYWTY